MENGNVDNDEAESVTLVLGNERFVANKKKLAEHSLYFSALFSGNFKDHKQNEFKINFDITPETLKHFLTWVDQVQYGQVTHVKRFLFLVRLPLMHYVKGKNHHELLELLEVSVVFMAEKLTEHVVEMIICLPFTPNELLDIWLIAEQWSLKVLHNYAFATCLDRFMTLDVAKLIKLPAENLVKLLLNVNLRSSLEHLLNILEMWKMENQIPSNLLESYSRFLNGTPEYIQWIVEQKEKTYVPCIAGELENGSTGVWSWNGKALEQMSVLTSEVLLQSQEESNHPLTGYQIIGRGFYLYLVGGELGIGSGKFNTKLWRYCPFTKKWRMLCDLPRPRRHMAVAFVHNKLHLIGGVGLRRCKSFSMDIFNVHTRKWTTGHPIPQGFTNPPPSCLTKGGKFIYQLSGYCIYDVRKNTWRTVDSEGDAGSTTSDPAKRFFQLGENDLWIIGTKLPQTQDNYRVIEPALDGDASWHASDPPVAAFTHIFPEFKQKEKDDWEFDQQAVVTWPHLLSFGHSAKGLIVEMGKLIKTVVFSPECVSGCEPTVAYTPVSVYKTSLAGFPVNGFSQRLGITRVLDIETLHNLVPVPEQESIDV